MLPSNTDPLQPVEEFMREFFRARIREEQRLQASRIPFRQSYYSADCQWDSRSQTLEMFESERIFSIEQMESDAKVITSHVKPFFPPDTKTQRLRYCLRVISDKWLITKVQLECPMCLGRGDETCLFCKGRLWV